MAPRHWLDPLARQLLIATGQLPRPSRPPVEGAPPSVSPPSVSSPSVSLQSWWQAARGAAAAVDPRLRSGANAADTVAARELEAAAHREAIERDLLALKLAQRPERSLRSPAEVERAAALGWRLDVNRATAADWLRLPGCTQEHADLLLRLQAGGVQLSGPEDLQRLLQLDPALLRSWLPLLEFRWYGAPPAALPMPIAINAAPPGELRRLPGLGEEDLTRLLRERGRAPFRDLADLQQRLQLPPALIEAWIGRVGFEPPPPGPRLPLSPRRPSR